MFKGDRDGSPRLHRKARKGQKEAEGDGRTDLRRQAMRNSSEVRRASREEAPEELIFLLRDAVRKPSGGRTKRDARVIDPRRAAEHRMALALPGTDSWKTSEPSGGAVR